MIAVNMNKEKYAGKKFSILGDSISTLEGFNPESYNVFYKDAAKEQFNVRTPQDTWWGQLIGFFGGKLLVNSSFSGCRVTKLPETSGLFPSGCSDERTNSLHSPDGSPDVIIVFMGLNDWTAGVPLTPDPSSQTTNETVFSFAYDEMLRKLKKNYPASDVLCCTLPKAFVGNDPNFRFPETVNNRTIDEFNEVILNSSRKNGCTTVSIHSHGIPYSTLDGTHPDSEGMKTLSDLILKHISGEFTAPPIQPINNGNNSESKKFRFPSISSLFSRNKGNSNKGTPAPNPEAPGAPVIPPLPVSPSPSGTPNGTSPAPVTPGIPPIPNSPTPNGFSKGTPPAPVTPGIPPLPNSPTPSGFSKGTPPAPVTPGIPPLPNSPTPNGFSKGTPPAPVNPSIPPIPGTPAQNDNFKNNFMPGDGLILSNPDDTSKPEIPDSGENIEFIKLNGDDGLSGILFSNTLNMYYETCNEYISVTKDSVTLGRGIDSDVLIKSSYVARQQATLLFNNNHWLIKDEFSTNGTKLNGTKLEPGKYYLLCFGDVLEFADSAKFIFGMSDVKI